MQGKQRDPTKKRKCSDDSSSLDYLNQLELQQNDDSRQDPQLSSKKRQRSWMIGESKQDKKVFISNNRKQRLNQSQSIHQGIFLYKPGIQLPNLFQFSNQIKVIIAAEYITKQNPEISRRNIYGTDAYTANSDLLCVAIHSGFINFNNFNAKKYQAVEMQYKVIKPKKNYLGSLRNGILSRSLKIYNGNALRAQNNKLLTSMPSLQVLQKYASNMNVPIGKNRNRPIPKNIRALVPNPQAHLTFNLNNQPAYKYSLINIADKGYNRSQFLTGKLDELVLYLETDRKQKYQISKITEQVYFRVYKIGKVKNPLLADNSFFRKNGAPLIQEHIDVIAPNLQWDEIIWGNSSIQLKDISITGIKSFKFYNKIR